MTTQQATAVRALVSDGAGARLEPAWPLPEAPPGEVVVRTRRAAVSGLDVDICRGLFAFQGVLGHEFVGTVESVADPGDAPLVGRRVVGAICTACGRCDMCQAGLSGHCRVRTVLGIDGRDGCLADRFLLPARNLVDVPDDVDDDHAVFASQLAAAIQAARQLTIEGKPFITILGDGPLGMLMAQVMSRLNASVRLVGRYSEKLALCEKWGIKHRHVDDVGRRADQDVVVDCTGTPGGLEVAMHLARPRGTVVLKTMLDRLPEPMGGADHATIVRKELRIVGSGPGPVAEALEAIRRGDVDVVSLISRRMTLADGPQLIQAAARPGVIKVVVDAA